MRRPSPFARRLALIAAAGFVLRAVWALAIAPESVNHEGDARYFHLTANLLADGEGYIAPLPFLTRGEVIPSSEHPPLWSALLALFSLAGARSYEAHELVACGVGAGTIACAGLLARRIGGGSERVGLIAAALCAVYPVFVAMDGSLMSEPPYALAVALCLVAAFRLVEAPGTKRALVLGLAIGAAVLTRGEALALFVVLLVPVALMLPREGRLRLVAIAFVVGVVTFAPWAIRNSTTFDRPVLVSTEDGPVIAGANCAKTYHGRDIGYWRSDCLPPGNYHPNAALRSNRLRSVGLEYLREHVGRFPAVEGVRLLRTAGLWQPRRHVFFAEGRMMPGRTVAVIGVWIVLALGLAGAVMLFRTRDRRGQLAILLAPAVLAVITTTLAFGYSRFRYATDVTLLVLAAYALTQFVRPRARDRAPAA